MTPDERAKALETTPLFANIHAEAASAGQTTVTEQDMHTDLHFTCFVQAPDPPRTNDIESPNPRRLLELDGRRVGPIDRGVSTNLLEVRITLCLVVCRMTEDTRVGCGEVRKGDICATDDERPVQHDGSGSCPVMRYKIRLHGRQEREERGRQCMTTEHEQRTIRSKQVGSSNDVYAYSHLYPTISRRQSRIASLGPDGVPTCAWWFLLLPTLV